MAKAAVSRLKQSSPKKREALSEEGEEIKSTKRKAIRVGSEETQYYMREAKSTENEEEEEERTFVPSAVCVPQKAIVSLRQSVQR